MLREKESELIISPATVRKNARRLFFIGKHGLVVTNADGSSSILTADMVDRDDRRKGMIKEGIVKEKQASNQASNQGNEKQKDRGETIGWCTCRKARKCPQIITKIIHQGISRLLPYFSFSLSSLPILSLFLSFYLFI